MPGKRDKAAFDSPEIVLTLALALARQGKAAAVRDMLAESLRDHPGETLYAQIAQFVLARSIPTYHAAMLVDGARNAAYRKAIEAAVPGKLVLDIGTGSGLLAMMAARAGAKRVVACEMNAALAETARRIIAANGLADRIEVYACHSGELDRASVCPAGFDVVVSEVFSANLLGEGVLHSLEQARERLCAPGAVFIPQSAELQVALAQVPFSAVALNAVEGFDLGLFADHLPLVEPITNGDPRLRLASNAATLARFDFARAGGAPPTGRCDVQVLGSGDAANGIAQWLTVDFGNGVTYENAPGSDDAAHWSIMAYPLPGPRALAKGEAATIAAFHHDDALLVWCDDA